MASNATAASRGTVRSLFAPSPALQVFVLTLLFGAAAVYEAVHLTSLRSGDIWWHLRTGLWILRNHAVPHTGLFSQYPDLPWIASSWGFEVLAASLYKLLGLRAIPVLLMGLKAALAVVTFLLARGGRSNFWMSVVLGAIAQYVIVDVPPLPVVFSMLGFGAELLFLFESRRTGDVRFLFWLLPLFLLWANLHIQFVCGLFLLGLFLLALCAERLLRSSGVTWLDNQPQPLPLARAGLVAGLSVACTLATPYSFHVLMVVPKTLYSEVSFQYLAEMRAMGFRRPQEYVLMLLVMAAFLALGRKRCVDIFKLSVLVAGTVVAFRIQRDAWLTMLPAIAVLGNEFHAGPPKVEPPNPNAFWKRKKTLAAVLTLIVFAAAASRVPDRNALMNKVGESFPVKACNFIRGNHLPAPLFNAYSWGGFLIWYLPDYPVAVDGRLDLYGEEILDRYFKVTTGAERLETDPSLAGARTLLLERESGMAKALTKLPQLSSQYRELYSDDLAAVFVRQGQTP